MIYTEKWQTSGAKGLPWTHNFHLQQQSMFLFWWYHKKYILQNNLNTIYNYKLRLITHSDLLHTVKNNHDCDNYFKNEKTTFTVSIALESLKDTLIIMLTIAPSTY